MTREETIAWKFLDAVQAGFAEEFLAENMHIDIDGDGDLLLFGDGSGCHLSDRCPYTPEEFAEFEAGIRRFRGEQS